MVNTALIGGRGADRVRGVLTCREELRQAVFDLHLHIKLHLLLPAEPHRQSTQ